MSLNATTLGHLRLMLGDAETKRIEQNARAAEALEQAWLAKFERLWRQLLDEAVDAIAKTGRPAIDSAKAQQRIAALLLEHELSVTEYAARTITPAEYVRAAKPKRWPTDLARIRELWDLWRRKGKLPGRTIEDAKAIKTLYIRRIQAFWQQRGSDFIRDKPTALDAETINGPVDIGEGRAIAIERRPDGTDVVHWNPDAFDREGARKAIEKAAAVGRARARTIIETETTRYYTTTRTNIYDQVDTVGGYLFVCVRDHATTKWCRSRGIPPMVLLKGTPALGKNTPPVHYNCRSELLPLSRLNPQHRRLLEDKTLWAQNRKLVPLLPGWNQPA